MELTSGRTSPEADPFSVGNPIHSQNEEVKIEENIESTHQSKPSAPPLHRARAGRDVARPLEGRRDHGLGLLRPKGDKKGGAA